MKMKAMATSTPRRSAAVRLALISSALLVACGGGGGGGAAAPAGAAGLASGYPSAPVSCEIANQKAWLRDYMNDQYFWYDQQGVPNEAATTPGAYLDSLLFKPLDRYSFAQSTASFTQFFSEGRRVGYGYSLAVSTATQAALKVRAVEPLSPVGQPGGLQRGDTIVSIDDLTPAQIQNGQLATVNTVGVPRKFVVTDIAGVQRTFTVNSADFALSPVLDARVLTAANGAKVGYLMYQEFIGTGDGALAAAFSQFKTQGVSELVLDLRYNGGGSTTQARNLASLTGGSALDGRVFAQFRFSAKQADRNFSQTFTANPATLGAAPLDTLARVFVITSVDTASASELVINSLRPFKPVVTIGSTTFGKPYAFQPRDACGTTYNAVNLQITNQDGFGDYSAGFAPTCPMSDDLTRQLGDPAELRTAAALTYISTGACPPVVSGLHKNSALAQSNRAQAATENVAGDRFSGLGIGEVSPRQARVD